MKPIGSLPFKNNKGEVDIETEDLSTLTWELKMSGIPRGDNRFKCKPYRHVWPVWKQGDRLMSNGTLPGEVCQCGEKIIIDLYCDCGCIRQRTVKVNSKEHKQWQNFEE